MKKQNAFAAVVIVAVAVATVLFSSAFKSEPQPSGYEYATIIQTGYAWISVTTVRDGYSEQKTELSKQESNTLNTRPLLNKIMEFEKDGWELMDIKHTAGAGASVVYIHVADLRKPIR